MEKLIDLVNKFSKMAQEKQVPNAYLSTDDKAALINLLANVQGLLNSLGLPNSTTDSTMSEPLQNLIKQLQQPANTITVNEAKQIASKYKLALGPQVRAILAAADKILQSDPFNSRY
jgi:hypothetical protein